MRWVFIFEFLKKVGERWDRATYKDLRSKKVLCLFLIYNLEMRNIMVSASDK